MRFAIPLVVLSAIFALAQQPAPRSQPQASPEAARADLILSKGLVDKNPDVRKEAVAALGLAAARDPYLGALASALDDKDVYVRLATVDSLVDLRRKEAIPALRKALNDTAPEVSFSAAKALWALDDGMGRAVLLSVLGGGAKTVSGPITAKERDMLRMFHTPRTLMIFAVRQGIGFVPFPGVGEGVSSLTLLLNDSGVSGRATAALLLARDKDPLVLGRLRESLSDKDGSVRAAAVHSLALRDDPALMPDMVALFEDLKDSVRFRAAASYVRLAGIQAAQAAANRGKKGKKK